MPAVAVIGAQWGDEGKGKVTHFLAERSDMVVRTQGGNNAGHTVVTRDHEYRVHIVPSGILYAGVRSVIANGVVVDPKVLLDEMAYLEREGIDLKGLSISDRAHLIMPYHRLLDGLEEDRRPHKIGTTRRGIGPAYMDKNARNGLRMVDLMEPERFTRRLTEYASAVNMVLERVYEVPPFDPEAAAEEYLAYGAKLSPYICDTSLLINQAIDEGQRVVFEGAQGTLLDVDHGTYPYVTSSHPTAGGVTIGSGVGPTRIDAVIGVAKAYTSRVGDGPFPTELHNDIGKRIREIGHEYGTTTGRPRRVGWLDAVMLRYAKQVNGMSQLALNHLDVLGHLPEVKLAVAYRLDGEAIRSFPASLDVLSRCIPEYRTFPGWGPLDNVKRLSDLPSGARAYVDAIQEETGLPIGLLSTGRERGETLILEPVFGVAPPE